jgi:hypothetical protein
VYGSNNTKNVGQDHVFVLVLPYFSFCIISFWLNLRSLSSSASVIAAGHLPPGSLLGGSDFVPVTESKWEHRTVPNGRGGDVG